MSEPTSQAWWVRDPSVPDAPAGPASTGPELAVTTRLPEPPEPAEPPDLVLTPAPAAAIDVSARRRSIALAAVAGAVLLVLVVGGWELTTARRASPATSGPVPSTGVRPVDPAAVTATASSTQHPDGQISYAAANTLNGDPATAWNSDGARDGKGPGISLTYRFTAPVDLVGISVLNGYQKVRPRAGKPALDLYPVNERVRRLRVVTDAGSWTWDLADTRTRQTFGAVRGSTRTVRLEVISVYPSSAYPDLALSEVSFSAAGPG